MPITSTWHLNAIVLIEIRPVQVAAQEQGGGLLVFNHDWLIAVLVKLSDNHGALSGQWFLETGYGRFAGREQPVFSDEAEALAWFSSHLADRQIGDPWEAGGA